MNESVPIIGQGPRVRQDEEMRAHILQLQKYKAMHQINIQVVSQEVQQHYDQCMEAKKKNPNAEGPNGLYMELLNGHIFANACAVTNVSATLALLHAMGVDGIPVPDISSITEPPEGTQTQ